MPHFLPHYPESEIKNRLTANETLERRIDLANTEGSSDKVYIMLLAMVSPQNTYVVRYLWGRNGSNLQMSTTSYASVHDAVKAIDNQYTRKIAKGYHCVEDHFYDKHPQSQAKTVRLPDTIGFIVPKIVSAQKEFALLSDDKIAVEQVPDPNQWVYIWLADGKFHIFDIHKTFKRTVTAPYEMLKRIASYNNYAFLGYEDQFQHIAIIDLLDPPLLVLDFKISPSKRSWAERRVMLSSIFDHLYGESVDFFSSQNVVYLNDYASKETAKIEMYHNSSDCLLFRNIKADYHKPLVIQQN